MTQIFFFFYSEGDKKFIFYFLLNIIPIIGDVNKMFCLDSQNFLYDICFNDQSDHSFNLSILSDSITYFYPQENIIKKIISYFNECIKNNAENVFLDGDFSSFYFNGKIWKK